MNNKNIPTPVYNKQISDSFCAIKCCHVGLHVSEPLECRSHQNLLVRGKNNTSALSIFTEMDMVRHINIWIIIIIIIIIYDVI